MNTRRSLATDPALESLRLLRRYGEGIADALDSALGTYRADCDQATREATVALHLRRAGRLAKDVIDGLARVPR